jgi:hypothetical protein
MQSLRSRLRWRHGRADRPDQFAGPALAFRLGKSGYRVIIVELADGVRPGGQTVICGVPVVTWSCGWV